MKQVPIGVSARHIHLSREHINVLFGRGYTLRVLKQLTQPGQFAAQEFVSAHGPKGIIAQIRIIGPMRRQTQLEISRTDSYALGLHPPLRVSGRLANTPGIKLVGPKGVLELKQGVIVAARHLHMHSSEAEAWGFKDRQLIKVRLNSERPLVLEQVYVRVSDHYKLDLHIDTDEANAAGVHTGDFAEIIE